jgi:hypothetical protein
MTDADSAAELALMRAAAHALSHAVDRAARGARHARMRSLGERRQALDDVIEHAGTVIAAAERAARRLEVRAVG